MNTSALFIIPVVIWGSTWLAITWQLGVVAPVVSVTYRFALASAALALVCIATGRSLRFGRRDHAFLAGVGLLMICVNYILVYSAERFVASGLVAVAYSTMVFVTPIGMRIAFGTPLEPRILLAATLGVVGVGLLFLPELDLARQGGRAGMGIGLTLLAVVACSVGNLIAVRNHNAGIPTIPGTVWTMGYGALFAAFVGIGSGASWTFDSRPAYIVSLAYLAVLGSVVAFVAYFTLLKRVGAARSSYTTVATPVIALLLSTLFEAYDWTPVAGAGLVLALFGNWLALRAAHGASSRQSAAPEDLGGSKRSPASADAARRR